MGTEITLAGYQLTGDEWRGLDEASRLQLLRALVEHTWYLPDEEPYESYELIAAAA